MKKLLDKIMTHNDSNPALFVTERKPHERLDRRGIQRIFSELGKRAGLSKRVYPRLLRHTTATVMLQNGASLMEVYSRRTLIALVVMTISKDKAGDTK